MTLEIWTGSKLLETCIDIDSREEAEERVAMLYGKPAHRQFECVLVNEDGAEIARW